MSASYPGTVVARFNKNFAIEDTQGQLLTAVARKKLPAIVCGDHIRWQPTDNGNAVICALEQRSTLLARPDRRGQQRPIAANIDQMIIVCAVQANDKLSFNTNLLDRYLISAELIGISAVIVINKIDLLTATDLAQAQADFAHYQNMAYIVTWTSTKQAGGLTTLSEQLADHTSIFVGESGAGKSSLINSLAPDHDIRVGELSAVSGLGQHTTTTTMLYHLATGGDLIDSPGVREFGLTVDDASHIARGFREFQQLNQACKFRDCRHCGEPGCAIAAAVEQGLIQPQRLRSYRSLVAELT